MWNDIENREYHEWHKSCIIIDTAGKTIKQCQTELKEKTTDSLLQKEDGQKYENIDDSLKATIIEKLCYKKLVYDRINRKLGLHLSPQEIESFISDIIKHTDTSHFLKKGKNYYITNDTEHICITVNSCTYRVITTDKI